jgi:hypothetical protein
VRDAPETPADGVEKVAARLETRDPGAVRLHRGLGAGALAAETRARVVRAEVAVLGAGEEEGVRVLELLDDRGRGRLPDGSPRDRVEEEELGRGRRRAEAVRRARRVGERRQRGRRATVCISLCTRAIDFLARTDGATCSRRPWTTGRRRRRPCPARGRRSRQRRAS